MISKIFMKAFLVTLILIGVAQGDGATYQHVASTEVSTTAYTNYDGVASTGGYAYGGSSPGSAQAGSGVGGQGLQVMSLFNNPFGPRTLEQELIKHKKIILLDLTNLRIIKLDQGEQNDEKVTE